MSYDVAKPKSQVTEYSVEQIVAGEKNVESKPAASFMPAAHVGGFVGGCPGLGRPAHRFFKRASDIVFSGCAIAVTAIPSSVLAAAIRLESSGNQFCGQNRMGRPDKDGSLTTFRMWKFRSKYMDAGECLTERLDKNEIKRAANTFLYTYAAPLGALARGSFSCLSGRRHK